MSSEIEHSQRASLTNKAFFFLLLQNSKSKFLQRQLETALKCDLKNSKNPKKEKTNARNSRIGHSDPNAFTAVSESTDPTWERSVGFNYQLSEKNEKENKSGKFSSTFSLLRENGFLFLLLMSLFGFFRYVLDLLLSFLSSKLSFSFFLSFFFSAIFSFFLFSLYLVLNFYSDATDYRSTISSNF